MKNKKGIAIVIVLVLATALLIMGGSYWTTIKQIRPVTDNFLQKAEASLLAEGILNIAILKFKELPSDFYYSYYIGRVTSNPKNMVPLNAFLELNTTNSLLNGTMTNVDGKGNDAIYQTDYQVLSQDKYTNDSIRIKVTVELKGITRVVSKILKLNRRRL